MKCTPSRRAGVIGHLSRPYSLRDLATRADLNDLRVETHEEFQVLHAGMRWQHTRISVLEGSMSQVKTDVAVLKTDVAVLKTDVAVLKTDVAVLKTDVAVLKTDVAVLKTDVAVLKTDVAMLKTDVATLKTDVGQLKADVSDLKISVSSLSGEVKGVQHSIHTIQWMLGGVLALLLGFIGVGGSVLSTVWSSRPAHLAVAPAIGQGPGATIPLHDRHPLPDPS